MPEKSFVCVKKYLVREVGMGISGFKPLTNISCDHLWVELFVFCTLNN